MVQDSSGFSTAGGKGERLREKKIDQSLNKLKEQEKGKRHAREKKSKAKPSYKDNCADSTGRGPHMAAPLPQRTPSYGAKSLATSIALTNQLSQLQAT